VPASGRGRGAINVTRRRDDVFREIEQRATVGRQLVFVHGETKIRRKTGFVKLFLNYRKPNEEILERGVGFAPLAEPARAERIEKKFSLLYKVFSSIVIHINSYNSNTLHITELYELI
jgi:hypothetical protein